MSQQAMVLQEKTAYQQWAVSRWARTWCCPLLYLHERYLCVIKR